MLVCSADATFATSSSALGKGLSKTCKSLAAFETRVLDDGTGGIIGEISDPLDKRGVIRRDLPQRNGVDGAGEGGRRLTSNHFEGKGFFNVAED
jgi:hypothetical protein